jgi:hypothetical protein
MPTFYPYNSKTPPFTVKNLGWLLKHSSEVTLIIIDEGSIDQYGALMRAHTDKGMFFCSWESFTLAQKWIDRPCLRHARKLVRKQED